jgi:hypothetical protein
MTLQSSGQIALSDLRTEYTNLGPQGQVAMNEFYYGSTYLKKNKCTDQARTDSSHPTKASHFDNVPVAGAGTTIALTNFYNKVYYYARQAVVQLSGNNASIDVNTIENESLKANSNNTVFFDAETTGNCRATLTSNYGLTIPQGARSNTTCYLTNDYAIYGKGGRGGDGGGSGSPGGTAFSVASNIYLKNNNRILGGGGGGGGSNGKRQTFNECYCCNISNTSIGGSGGGGGKGGGAGGGGSGAPPSNFPAGGGGSGGDGDENTSSVPGSGGGGGGRCGGYPQGTICSDSGGPGGGWGQAGSPAPAGGGGSGGNAIRRRSSAYYVVLTSGTQAGSTVTF